MRKWLLRSIVALIAATALGLSDQSSTMPGSPIDEMVTAATLADEPPTEAGVVGLLQRWADQIRPGVPEEERQKVEQFVAGYPLEAPPGAEPVSFQKAEGEGLQIDAQINRRDWAYSMQGAAYTLAATLGEGQQSLLDVGFWCYLEAALLKPDEPEHLANVGFHLNLRQATDDAKIVLIYARSLNEASSPIRNNLAFSYARAGDYAAAAEQQQWAAALRPDQPIYQERLADYWEQAGQPQLAEAVRVPLEMVNQGIPMDLPVPPLPPMSGAAQAAKGQIGNLDSETERRLSESWASYKPRLDAASQQLQASLDQLGAAFQACASGGPMVLQEACSQCMPPWEAGVRSAATTWYETVKPLVASYEIDAFNMLGEQTQKGNELVAASEIGPAEKRILYEEVARRIFDDHYEATTNGTAWAASELQSMLGMQALIGFLLCQTGSPIAIPTPESAAPKPVRLDNPKQPNFTLPFYFNFLVGSIQRTTDGTYKLSLGQAFMAKMQLNVFSGETAAGFAVGFDLPHGLKGEANLMFRPKFLNYRVEAGADLKLKLPSLVPLPIPEPAVGVKAIVFENST